MTTPDQEIGRTEKRSDEVPAGFIIACRSIALLDSAYIDDRTTSDHDINS